MVTSVASANRLTRGMELSTSRKPMRPVAFPIVLALHLLALYAFNKWAGRPPHVDVEREKEVTILLLPHEKTPPKPEKQPPPEKLTQAPPRAQELAASRHEAEKSAATPGSTPASESASDPAHAPEPAQPRHTAPPAPGVYTTDPAALVASYGYVDSRSELRKTIEEHGGVVELQPKNKYQLFADAVDAAQIPYCLGRDGLKLDPPKIGPVNVGGELAAVFMVDAAIRGKCKIVGR